MKKNILVMPISFGHYDDQVIPCVDSILLHEPTAKIVIVDNGSPEPFPLQDNAATIHIKPPGNAPLTVYFSFLNFLEKRWDWAVLLNADVRCTGPFLEAVSALDPMQIHGNTRYEAGGESWIDAWCFIISHQFLRKVGRPDPTFEIPGHFQDCDYCMQAKSKGFTTHQTNLPITHLETHTGHLRPDFWNERERNRERVFKNHGFRIP